MADESSVNPNTVSFWIPIVAALLAQLEGSATIDNARLLSLKASGALVSVKQNLELHRLELELAFPGQVADAA